MSDTNPALIEGTERKLRTIRRLEGLGIPVHPGLPWIETTHDTRLPTSLEVAQRAVAAMTMAVKSQSEGNVAFVQQLIDELSCRKWLTLGEREFLAMPPGEGDEVAFSWRWEGVAALLWALQVLDLPWPAGPIMANPLFEMVRALGTADAIASKGLRPLPEILDEADLYYRLHWAVRDNALRGLPIPADLDANVVVERDRTLRWLVSEYSRDWDEIDLST